MTETEWLTCSEPTPMLELLEGKATGRKLGLFAVACCESIWDLLVDERSRRAVEVTELAMDGQVTIAQCLASAEEAGNVCTAALAKGPQLDLEEMRASYAALFVVLNECRPFRRPSQDEHGVQTALLRCIFGNPFRAVPLDPNWLIPTVTTLARIIYDERSFDQMPELADALEAAGCTSEQILAHCREPGEHARGCWVVDLLLRKE